MDKDLVGIIEMSDKGTSRHLELIQSWDMNIHLPLETKDKIHSRTRVILEGDRLLYPHHSIVNDEGFRHAASNFGNKFNGKDRKQDFVETFLSAVSLGSSD